MYHFPLTNVPFPLLQTYHIPLMLALVNIMVPQLICSNLSSIQTCAVTTPAWNKGQSAHAGSGSTAWEPLLFSNHNWFQLCNVCNV